MNQFSFCTTWVQGSNSGSQALMARAFTCLTNSLKAWNGAHIAESLPEAFSLVLQELKSDLTVEEATAGLLRFLSRCCVPGDLGGQHLCDWSP